MSPSPYLLLRAYCEGDKIEQAQSVAHALYTKLAKLGEATVERVEPYWKFADTYELCALVIAEDNEDVLLEKIERLFDVSWSVQGELIVWERKGDRKFDSLPMIWASSEYVIPATD